ncbi:MAG: sugar phosphate transferase [Pyrobaculum sp.]
MEIAVRGSIGPRLATPTPYLIVGGFRLVELAALAFCERGKVVIYVEEAVDLPLVLEGCRFEVRKVDMLPPDVYTVEAGCVPYLLKSRHCTNPISTIADMVEINTEVMRWALDRIKQLGIEPTRGDVRGHVYGDVYNRGKIYEYTYVEGPAVIGPTSEVLPFTYLRQGSVLYHNSKVRDEVKNSIFDAYTRKQHGGYVGDSYVASFVNMGAGTNVSNLKNTLGPIKTSYSSKKYRKLGPIVGEFVKTAIGTLIYGGRYIGPLSHLYGVVERDVPPLSIYRHGEITPVDREKARELVARDLAQFGRIDLLHFYLTSLGARE